MSYVLNSDQRKMVCEWIKQLKFPDGYASNISRCINVDEGKMYGRKSHDCHVFMQRLIPLAFRDMLPKPIWGVLIEVSLFFKVICANAVHASVMEHAKISIIKTICKLEKIFPLTFFDLMEHLVIHLPREVKVEGPVQYRWMYPFERCMLYLKRKVRNKAKVEGSICEAYVLEEISNFALMFVPDSMTRDIISELLMRMPNPTPNWKKYSADMKEIMFNEFMVSNHLVNVMKYFCINYCIIN